MTETRWKELAEWPLMGAALAFLVAAAVMVVGQPVGPVGAVTRVVMAGTWLLFFVDLAVRVALAKRRGPWLLRHWYDLAVLVLPVLRPLRLLRLVTMLGGMRRSAGTEVRGQAITYAAGWAVVLLVVSSLAALNAERGAPGATIETWGEALWWATVTVTSVGYGDYSPVTPVGRAIAVGLMFGGIALLAVVTATLASWILERVAELDGAKVGDAELGDAGEDRAGPGEVSPAATRAQVTELAEEIAALRRELAARDARGAPPGDFPHDPPGGSSVSSGP
ncbi:potassium channel family protein [Dietzia sp. B32]|uniref:potassium channel family protein n=1 Tax=Dietzia sp. B32 TaxID=2915130 RepID=UPI0021ADFEE3|nr:ion channel [Dietzia sp. B32]UVE93905.1 ion channel [Dietzia sp. B32]